jgi:hypothetical protein
MELPQTSFCDNCDELVGSTAEDFFELVLSVPSVTQIFIFTCGTYLCGVVIRADKGREQVADTSESVRYGPWSYGLLTNFSITLVSNVQREPAARWRLSYWNYSMINKCDTRLEEGEK